VLTLHLQRRCDGVVDLPLTDEEEGTRTNCGVGPEALEPVGEAVGSYSKICAGMRVKPLGEVLTTTTEDGEIELERRIEASCADDDIEVLVLAIFGVNPCRGDSRNVRWDEVNLRSSP